MLRRAQWVRVLDLPLDFISATGTQAKPCLSGCRSGNGGTLPRMRTIVGVSSSFRTSSSRRRRRYMLTSDQLAADSMKMLTRPPFLVCTAHQDVSRLSVRRGGRHVPPCRARVRRAGDEHEVRAAADVRGEATALSYSGPIHREMMMTTSCEMMSHSMCAAGPCRVI